MKDIPTTTPKRPIQIIASFADIDVARRDDILQRERYLVTDAFHQDQPFPAESRLIVVVELAA